MNLLQELESLVLDLNSGLSQASSLQILEELRVVFLGRKGKLAQIMTQLPSLEVSLRPVVGKKANEIKEVLNSLFEAKKIKLEQEQENKEIENFDPSIPGRKIWQGSLHPVTLIVNQISEVFMDMGYQVAMGPEVENDYYNFEALNIPAEHPARDMQDTLYITENILLRTHTSPMQVRIMKKYNPPLAIIVPGKVYRRDSDLTHTPMFHQIEGLLVNNNVSMSDLRGTLTVFAHKLFGPKTCVRFRPSFFPFTEPSAEVDISCPFCSGQGKIKEQPCRICKQTGWLEILGCGMVDPEVFKAVGYDPNKYTGFAFGLGLERIAMLKFGITDLRMFFENDIRFLKQFA